MVLQPSFRWELLISVMARKIISKTKTRFNKLPKPQRAKKTNDNEWQVAFCGDMSTDSHYVVDRFGRKHLSSSSHSPRLIWPLKMDAWKIKISSWGPIFRGDLLVSGRVSTNYIHLPEEESKQRVVYIWMWSKEGFLDPGTSFPNKQQKWIHTPGDSKWPFDSLVRGHLTFPNAHLTIPKRAQRIARLIMFFFFRMIF